MKIFVLAIKRDCMAEVIKVAPKRVAGTSRTGLPHEKSVTVATAAQHMNSPFSGSLGKSGVGLPWGYGFGHQWDKCNVLIFNIVSWIKI